MSGLMTLLSLPILLLNAFGGLVAIVWLAILGEWPLVGMAVISFLVGTFAVSLLLIPSMIFGAPGVILFEKGLIARFFGAILMFFASLWTYGVMAFWCLASFYAVSRYLNDGWQWPHLLLAYSIGTSPWTYLAAKEGQSGDNTASSMSAFALCVGAFALLLVLAFSDEPSPSRGLTALLAPLAIALVAQWLLAMAVARAQARPFG